MTGQKLVRLADIVTIGGESLDPQKFPSEVFHLFSIPAFDSERMPETIQGNDIGSVKRTILSGDCLFSKLNPRINRVWVVPQESGYRQIASPEFWPLRVKPQVDLSPFYLAHLLSWQTFRDEVIGREEAATKSRSRLKPEQLLSKAIPVPPLDEQRRIVAILDEAEALRQLRARADARMADFIPALFNQIFGDPAHLLSMKWPFEQVDSFAEVSYGLADKLDVATTSDQGTRIITISNVTLDGELDLSVERYSLADEASRAKAQLQTNDLLFNWRNGSEQHVGKTALWTEQIGGEVLHVSFLLKIRPNLRKVDPHYLWALMNRLRSTGYFTRSSRFQVNTKFNASELSALRLPLPPLTLQREFAAQVADARAMQAQQARVGVRLEEGFQALLHRAFSGEL